MLFKPMHSDIWKYYAYMILSNLLFFLPVDIIFFQERGLSVTEIFLINALFLIGVAILEVPTGVIADMLGRKKSIVLGILTWICSFVIFFYGWGFPVLASAYLLWALGLALVSGADTALFYDILHKQNKHEAFKKYQGIAKTLGRLSVGGSALLGGVIASYDLGWTFLASAIPFVGCLYILSSIKHKEAPKKKNQSYAKIISQSLRLIKSSRWLLWLLAISVLFEAGHVLLRPLQQIYLEQVGLDISLFGVATAYWFFVGAMSSVLAYPFEKKLKRWSYFFLAALWLLGMVLIANIFVKWGFLLFGIVVVSTAIASIIIEHEILKNFPKEKHATVLSFQNLLERLIMAGVIFVFGYYVQQEGISFSVSGVALIASVLFVLFFLWYLLIPKTKLSE